MIYLWLVTCMLCLALLWWFRHNVADNRGGLLVASIVACLPVVNVLIVLGVVYAIYAHASFIEWLKKPLRRDSP